MGEDALVFGRNEAAQYEAWFETEEGRRFDRKEKALMGRLLSDFGRPGTMLEIGCGTGHFARWFGDELGWEVYGVDISWPMLEESQVRAPQFPVALADSVGLPVADASCDVAVIITALEFMAEPVAALREAVRVSRRGIMICVLNRWSLLAIWRRVQGLFIRSAYDKAHFLSAGELQHMLRQAAGELPCGLEMRTAVLPGILSFLEESRWPWGAFLGVRVDFERPT